MTTLYQEFSFVFKSMIKNPLMWGLVILAELMILSQSKELSMTIKLFPFYVIIVSLVGQTFGNYFHNYFHEKWITKKNSEE